MRISDWSSDVCSSDLVKFRAVKLGGNGFEGAKAHLRYVERDGTTREGGRGQLYGADTDRVDRSAWVEQSKGDRHQFRIIVSAEDGVERSEERRVGKECVGTGRSGGSPDN